MAKTAKCAFCGTEVTTGFFKGNAKMLYLGQEVPCCEGCYRTYGVAAEKREKRIKTKIENLKKSKRVKLTSENIAMLVKKYLAEEALRRESVGSPLLPAFFGFFRYDENGYFSVQEFLLSSFLEGDSSIEEIGASKATSMVADGLVFTKDDISRIEYRRATKLGVSTGLFSEAHSFEIRLNDTKIFTYKPCITRLGVEGYGLLPFLAAKNAERQVLEALELFKQVIGSDLPIVKVKKFY